MAADQYMKEGEIESWTATRAYSGQQGQYIITSCILYTVYTDTHPRPILYILARHVNVSNTI